jgi:hypothetical protein
MFSLTSQFDIIQFYGKKATHVHVNVRSISELDLNQQQKGLHVLSKVKVQ